MKMILGRTVVSTKKGETTVSALLSRIELATQTEPESEENAGPRMR